MFLNICVVHAAVYIQLKLGHISRWACAALPVPDKSAQVRTYVLFRVLSDRFQQTGASNSRPTNYRSVRLG
jgi:hypothetical protein